MTIGQSISPVSFRNPQSSVPGKPLSAGRTAHGRRPGKTATKLDPGGSDSESAALHACSRLAQTAEEAESRRPLGALLPRHAATQACSGQAMLTHAQAKQLSASTEPRRQAAWREAALVVEESWQPRRARRRRVARRAPPPRLLEQPRHLPPRPRLPNGPPPAHAASALARGRACATIGKRRCGEAGIAVARIVTRGVQVTARDARGES